MPQHPLPGSWHGTEVPPHQLPDRGERGVGWGRSSSAAVPASLTSLTWTNAPPGSSISKTIAATRSRSIQWNDWPNVATRNVPNPAGSSSPRARTQRALPIPTTSARRAASASIPGSGSTPTASSKNPASGNVSTPGPQPTSINRPLPSSAKTPANRSPSPGAYGSRPRA